MAAHSLEELHSLYAARMTGGDLDGLVDLYEDVATFNGGQAGQLHGSAAIREHLCAMLAKHPTLELTTRAVVTAAGVALLASDWRFTVRTDDGEQRDTTGTSVEVARRQADGTWRYLIDEPAFLE